MKRQAEGVKYNTILLASLRLPNMTFATLAGVENTTALGEHLNGWKRSTMRQSFSRAERSPRTF